MTDPDKKPKGEPGLPVPTGVNQSTSLGGLALIPLYNGSRESSLKIKDFIETIDQVSELEGWDEKRKLGALKLALRGEAKYLIRGEKSVYAKKKLHIPKF